MKSNLYIFALWVLLGVKVAVAIPVPLGADVSHKWTLASAAGRVRAGIGKDQAIQNVNTAVTDAHEQVLSMERVLQDPSHPGRHEILQKSFGNDYEQHLPAITQGVQTLKEGHLHVTNVFGNDKGTIGVTIPGQNGRKEVHTGFTFHKNLGPEARAGNIVHEASHALLNTQDYHAENPFSHKLEAIDNREAARRRPGEVSTGYAWHRNYNHVINNHQDPTSNADSWRMFGFHARHGLEHKLPEGKTLERSTHGHSLASVAAAIHPGTAHHLAHPRRH